MSPEEFLEKVKIELKISKNSEYTLKNYLKANENLLNFSNKQPEQITEDDVKHYISENLTDKASPSIILFLAAIKYSYLNILKRHPTSNNKRPKREQKLRTV